MLFAPTTRTALRPTPLWPWLVTAALLLLVVDVFLRRVDVALMLGRRSNSGGGLARATPGRPAQAPPGPPDTPERPKSAYKFAVPSFQQPARRCHNSQVV